MENLLLFVVIFSAILSPIAIPTMKLSFNSKKQFHSFKLTPDDVFLEFQNSFSVIKLVQYFSLVYSFSSHSCFLVLHVIPTEGDLDHRGSRTEPLSGPLLLLPREKTNISINHPFSLLTSQVHKMMIAAQICHQMLDVHNTKFDFINVSDFRINILIT